MNRINNVIRAKMPVTRFICLDLQTFEILASSPRVSIVATGNRWMDQAGCGSAAQHRRMNEYIYNNVAKYLGNVMGSVVLYFLNVNVRQKYLTNFNRALLEDKISKFESP